MIPLVSSEIANSWEQVCRLFERCVKSICNQTSSNFRVVVVCNEKPAIGFEHPSLSYITVDFLPDAKNIEAKTLDRGRKILVGLNWARKLNPTHAMAVDADDCVSKRLATFVEQHSQSDGWFINQGYVYKDGAKTIYFKGKKFNDICGTCNIIKYSRYDLYERLEERDVTHTLQYYGGHKYILKELETKGTNIQPLPFPGAVYVVENGENYYNHNFGNLMVPKRMFSRLRSMKNYRILTPCIRKEFGLVNE
ncbi:glycosyltransferase family A protein [Oculatella sp. LEGE 06141]|uniref:glycosyltransferase family A protein n=1 Tax=Oculatella sp. LEGE 06141 TaxID=1828648 RepID=UPI0030DD5AB1